MCECKVCKKLKTATDGGPRSNTSGRHRLDEKGRKWNGRVCPDCRQEIARKYAAGELVPVAEPVQSVGSDTVLNPPKLRRCSDCGLMSANYFKCPPCTSHAMEEGCLEEVSLVTGGFSGRGFRAGIHY